MSKNSKELKLIEEKTPSIIVYTDHSHQHLSDFDIIWLEEEINLLNQLLQQMKEQSFVRVQGEQAQIGENSNHG